MTYNVFSGTLNPTQSILNQSVLVHLHDVHDSLLAFLITVHRLMISVSCSLERSVCGLVISVARGPFTQSYSPICLGGYTTHRSTPQQRAQFVHGVLWT